MGPLCRESGGGTTMRERKRAAMKKIYVMTDLEGVAGVLDSVNWCLSDGRYYDQAKVLLTLEVNAAVSGFFDGGAVHVVVSDGHGPGGINPALIDPRVDLIRGWPNGWPLEMGGSYDAVAFVGQHAKASTERAHLCHTQNMRHINFSINGVSIGEFGQLAMCASELEVRTIFGSGDEAFTREARALVPGIETVSVKRGLRKGQGLDLTDEQYRRHNTGAVHVPPERARMLIRAGACRGLARARKEKFGIIKMRPPYARTVILRPTRDYPLRQISKERHPRSVIALLNMEYKPRPIT